MGRSVCGSCLQQPKNTRPPTTAAGTTIPASTWRTSCCSPVNRSGRPRLRGLFLVLQRAHTAAQCALDLQAALARLDLAKLGLSVPLPLRLAGHLGPVYERLDPVLGHNNFFGAHVTRAAHIE